jgi:hypothetical protein
LLRARPGRVAEVDVDVHASLAQVLGISNPWVERFLELSVDLAAVADGEDEHHEHVVVDLIGDAVVAGTDSPFAGSTDQLLRRGRGLSACEADGDHGATLVPIHCPPRTVMGSRLAYLNGHELSRSPGTNDPGIRSLVVCESWRIAYA